MQTAVKILIFLRNHQIQTAVHLLYFKWTFKLLMTMKILIYHLRIGKNKKGKNKVK
jgi:hypothetical protein